MPEDTDPPAYERTEDADEREKSPQSTYPSNRPAQPSVPDGWHEALHNTELGGPDPEYLRGAIQQAITPRQVISAVRVAVRRWLAKMQPRGYDAWELACIGFDAAIQNFKRIVADRNPPAMCYRVADRCFRKIYREEFGEELAYDATDAEGQPIPIEEVFGASGTTFAQPASPDIWSQWLGEQIEQAWFSDLLERLPGAMAQLRDVEHEIVKLYFGFDSAEMTGQEIAEAKRLPTRTVYFHLENGIAKLRRALELEVPAPERMAA